MAKKIEVKNISFIYGNKIEDAKKMLLSGAQRDEIQQKTGAVVGVNNASFDIKENEVFVIMGLSGSGKSTVLKCLNLLLRPCCGEIFVDGENILNYSQKELRNYRQKKTCMVFQEYGLLPHRTVEKNVEFGLEIEHVDKAVRKEKVQYAIDLVGLTGWEKAFPKELSGGMQQRVGFARALANEPDILLMDEPFSALDPLIRKQLQKELKSIQERLKKSIVFITHDINEAFFLGDRVAIMKDAIIEQIGTPLEILQNPASDYVKEFIGDINRVQVLRCRDIMQPVEKDFMSETILQAGDPIRSALEKLQRSGDSAIIMDGEDRVGYLTYDRIVNVCLKGLDH